MPFNLGFSEIVVLAVVAVLVFGGNLPDAAHKVGRAITEFKRGWNREVAQFRPSRDDDPAAWSRTPPAPRDAASPGADDGEDADETPPPDWTPPPDGEDCRGLD